MEQLAAGISFGGVVLIARPTSLFISSSALAPPASGDGDIQLVSNATITVADASNYDNVTPAQRAGAVGLALVGVLGAVAAFTTIRWIGKRAHPLLSVNYFAAWCTIVSTVMMLALPQVGFLLPSGLKEWCYLFFLGICGFIMVSHVPSKITSCRVLTS
jgi:drug/metabolite transporter (DMT)-like permease